VAGFQAERPYNESADRELLGQCRHFACWLTQSALSR
jgi:hypothetical protein